MDGRPWGRRLCPSREIGGTRHHGDAKEIYPLRVTTLKVVKAEKERRSRRKESSHLEEEMLCLSYPVAQSLFNELAQESNVKGTARLYRIYLIRSKLHPAGAEIKQLYANLWYG